MLSPDPKAALPLDLLLARIFVSAGFGFGILLVRWLWGGVCLKESETGAFWMWTFDMLHFRKPGVILSALLLCHPERSGEDAESKDPFSYAFPFGEGGSALAETDEGDPKGRSGLCPLRSPTASGTPG